MKDQENIADAMTMRITAEDGKTNDYTIKQKNTYNWALDYAGPQQGNVWFGQKKAASGEWTEIKEYDSHTTVRESTSKAIPQNRQKQRTVFFPLHRAQEFLLLWRIECRKTE